MAVGVAGGFVGACSGSDPQDAGATGAGTSAGAGGAGGGTGPTARSFFEAFEADLVEDCGPCHKEGGLADAPFLAAPDRYTSITSWPGIVVKSPSQSILLTHPGEPTHGGGEAPDIRAEMKPKVLEWLTIESQELPTSGGEIGPSVTPFKPFLAGAFNTVYLDQLGPEFEYMSISFNAKAIGGTTEEPTMLWINNITVHTVPEKPLHIVHPLFTVYYPSTAPDPDPVDSFSNVDQTFTIDGNPMLGTGEVVLTNWRKGAYLGIAFELIEVYGGTPGTGGTCKDPVMFETVVAPAMQKCMECHAGKYPQAKGAMNLSELNTAPATACIQVRSRITPGDPANSQILIVTNPGGIEVHMYKFDGVLPDYETFKSKVSPWIDAEK
jgi:hypothetical protein